MTLKITQTRLFGRQKKKLHSNQQPLLDQAVKEILKNPSIGQQKKGDLSTVRVHKFKMNAQEWLLAYQINTNNILLITLGSHENFYRNLKRSL